MRPTAKATFLQSLLHSEGPWETHIIIPILVYSSSEAVVEFNGQDLSLSCQHLNGLPSFFYKLILKVEDK